MMNNTLVRKELSNEMLETIVGGEHNVGDRVYADYGFGKAYGRITEKTEKLGMTFIYVEFDDWYVPNLWIPDFDD